jgi:hypothetical protein
MSDWDKVGKDILWAMKTGNGVSTTGRNKMKEPARMNDVSYMGEFKEGFYLCQNDVETKANFDSCCHDDQGRVYSIGRMDL